LIIDVRNNGGGSDRNYEEIIPFLYTNPMRQIGVALYSTKLNNQRMLDFISNPKYGLDEKEKSWAKTSYDTLEKHIGEFVNLESQKISIDTLDKIYPYPKNVGIIINKGNGSTTEQFLLAAKQSKKVKLFGVTTAGVLDISNMNFVESPCKEFELGYSISKSFRIPDMAIDGKGIMPDYYIDKEIKDYDWIDYVNKILNQK
jgi:C-terminal processing protease CtpA/Prc